jgi:putative CocE/NonD family hydrolase
MQLRWFGRWLADEAPATAPARRSGGSSRVPIDGARPTIGRWRAWASGRCTCAAGELALEPPGGNEPPAAYAHDSEQPCPTRGGAQVISRHHPAGPVDQGPLLDRRDMPCFTSPPLEDALEVIGRVRGALRGHENAPDTDCVVKLCRVEAAGRTLNICDGILRASYRRSPSERHLVEPGKVERTRSTDGPRRTGSRRASSCSCT